MIGFQGSLDILYYGSGLTLVVLFASLAIFGWLPIRNRNIRSFDFQLFIFILIYIVGEILEDYKIPSLYASLPYLGSYIHILAGVFLALVLWFRIFLVRNSGRRTIDKLDAFEENGFDDASKEV
jgi:hypothetical protein